MIASHDLGPNARHDHALLKRLAHQKVIDAPPCIVGTRIETIAPPGIGPFGSRMQTTEGIDEACF